MGVGSEQPQSPQVALGKGSHVEVSTDEEGLKGAWYVATVVDTPSNTSSSSGSKKRKTKSNKTATTNSSFYVEYQSLFADEDGSKPLREHVHSSFVRPLPPSLDPGSEQSFQLYDVVDAFCRDGWWTGVITRVVGDSRFVVTFQNPPDEIEFGLSELRVHRDWVDGKWVEPDKQSTTGFMFSTGKSVEVSFDRDDCRDVWFPAIVLEDVGNNSFLVEQGTSENDGDAEIEKVVVDSFHIRPSPPHLKRQSFILLEKVDVYLRFGWWSGVITKELPESRYIVFFKHTNKEREVNYSELRPHMEWVDGKWVSATQDVLIPSDVKEKGLACNEAKKTGIAVLASPCLPKDKSEERTPSYGVTSQRLKTKQAVSNIDASHARHLKKLKEGNAAEAPSPTACEFNTIPTQTPIDEALCGNATPTTGDTGTNCSNQPVAGDHPSATKSLYRRKKASGQEKVELDKNSTGPVKKRGRPPKTQTRSPQRLEAGKEGNVGVNGTEEFVEKKCITKEMNIPSVIGLECNEMQSEVKESYEVPTEESPLLMRDQKQKSNDPTRQKIKEINQLVEVGESNPKKRRGRRPHITVRSLEASGEGKIHNPDAVVADEIVVKDCITSDGGTPITVSGSKRKRGSRGDDKEPLKSPLRQKTTFSRTKKVSPSKKVPPSKKDKQPKQRVSQSSSKQNDKHPSTRGRRRSAGLNTDTPIQGTTTEVFERGSMTKGAAEMGVEELRNSVSDDQPLSMWFEGMHSPTNVDGPRISSGQTPTQRQNEIVLHSTVVGTDDDILTDEQPSLPFVKNFPLWRTIESMEVFRLMPQHPHFSPLSSCKESSREGLAIGSMVTFSSVVKRTSELRFNDSRSIIEDSLETLVDLESHGFDVQFVRDRLTGLLLIKDNQEQLEEQSKDVKSRIPEHENEKSEIDEEIGKIDEQIKKLHEKRSQAMSKKESKECEIASLKSKVDHIDKDMKSVQLDFEGLVTAPW